MDKFNNDEIENEIDSDIVTPNYTSYDELEDFEDSELPSCAERIIKILNEDKSNTWLPQFNSIENLRRLLKFRRKDFFKAFHQVYKVYHKQLNSIRSGCCKISLILLSELFSDDCKDIHSEWIEVILPLVFGKTTNLQKFIKEEANSVLFNCSKHMFYYEVLDIFVQNIGSKNLHAGEVAFECFSLLIQNWEFSSLCKLLDFHKILSKIIEIFKLKKEPFNKRAIKATGILFEKLGKNQFENLTNKAGGEVKMQIHNILKLNKLPISPKK